MVLLSQLKLQKVCDTCLAEMEKALHPWAEEDEWQTCSDRGQHVATESVEPIQSLQQGIPWNE